MPKVLFVDGPAEGHPLDLERDPIMLRVTIGLNGVDALDQLEDEPAEHESIFVYMRVKDSETVALVDWADKGGRRRGAKLSIVEYCLSPIQPTCLVRDTASWQVWCNENKDAIMAAFAKGGA